MGAEDDCPEFHIAAGRRASRSISAAGGKHAISLGVALIKVAHWPALRINLNWTDDPFLRGRRVTVRYHPDGNRRDVSVIVLEDDIASEVRSRHIRLTESTAVEAAVHLAAGARLPAGLLLQPLEPADAERILAKAERPRMVVCDCGGLRLRVPFVGSWCWRERIDPHRAHRTHWAGKPMTKRQRIVAAIERATFGLI
ncbi:hypothetical protein [Pseudolysinimonas sp.]